jgi:hypothetical protein
MLILFKEKSRVCCNFLHAEYYGRFLVNFGHFPTIFWLPEFPKNPPFPLT